MNGQVEHDYHLLDRQNKESGGDKKQYEGTAFIGLWFSSCLSTPQGNKPFRRCMSQLLTARLIKNTRTDDRCALSDYDKLGAFVN